MSLTPLFMNKIKLLLACISHNNQYHLKVKQQALSHANKVVAVTNVGRAALVSLMLARNLKVINLKATDLGLQFLPPMKTRGNRILVLKN